MLENVILLLGLGTNKSYLDKIKESVTLQDVKNTYGADSCFYKAMAEIRKISDAQIDILNLDAWEDIRDHEDELNAYSYDFVIPLDLYISEMYFDEYYGVNMLYSQLILMSLNSSISTVIMTGKHASNFEDLSQYLDYEKESLVIPKKVFGNLKKEHIVYISNGLKDFHYGNAVLAAVMANTDYSEYPSSAALGEAYFDIDYSDVSNELAYYKNNYLINTTIENLINFSGDKVLKLVPVYRIIKYFYYHNADVEKYIGTAYTDYKLVKIMEAEKAFLDKCVDWIIYKYEIKSVTPVLDEYGAVTILVSFDIWPKFTTEKYTVEIYL